MQGKRVVAVDDEEVTGQLLALIFSREGAEVHTALNFDQGMHLFHQHRPDLMLVDLMMPGIDGLQMCRHLRDISNVPIIIISAQIGRAHV